MKFIVNSKNLAHRITEAISEGAKIIKCGEWDDIRFENENTSISCSVHFLEQQSWNVQFDVFTWFKIVKVLQRIPEQPITVNINNEFIDIFMEYRFKITQVYVKKEKGII